MTEEEKRLPEAGGEMPPADGAVEAERAVETDRAVEAERAVETDRAVEAERAVDSGEAAELDATEPADAGVDEDADDGFMSAADAKLAEANARYVRLAADFDNYRKRAQRDCAELAAGAGEALIRDFLPVLDNLERALAACAEARVDDGSRHAAAVESVVKGVELTMRQFQLVLARQGVERIVVVGEAFNPHRHEALMQVERDDVAADTVTEELEAGYTLRGRVVRSAKVKVARPSAGASSSRPEGSL
jgi:molecular chaperone GrpE